MGIDDGLPIAEAAQRLGITPAALRKRIKRGTVQAYKVDGQWYAVVPGGDDTGYDAGRDAGTTSGHDGRPPRDDELVAELRSRIAYLEAALAREQANVQMIAQRALPAPREEPEAYTGGSNTRRRWWWPWQR